MEKDPSEREEVLRHYEGKSLGEAGGSVTLYTPADVKREFGIEPETEVEFDVIERDGKVGFLIPLPRGFNEEELLAFSEERGWNTVQKQSEEDRWAYTFEDPSGLVEIQVDSNTHINRRIINNIVIKGPAVNLKGDIERYKPLYNAAEKNDLSIDILDPDGLWTKLSSTEDFNPSDPPKPNEVKMLLETGEDVNAQLTKWMASLTTTLSDVGEIVKTIREISKREK